MLGNIYFLFYSILSRVTKYDKFFCKGELNASSIRVNILGLEEYERLRQYSIFDTIEKVAILENSTTLLLLNVQSPLKHALDIVSDDKLRCFTETLIQPHYSTQSLFKNVMIYISNNSNKFLNLVYGLHNNLGLLK